MKTDSMARDATRMARPAAALLPLVLAMTLLVAPAPADAESVSVTVTARIAPVFELTVLTDGAVSFGDLAAGGRYTAPEVQRFRVRTNRPWDFTDSSDTLIALGATPIVRERIARHAVDPGFGTSISPGVHEITARYTIDLTAPEALDLPAGTTIATRFGYTAVQR